MIMNEKKERKRITFQIPDELNEKINNRIAARGGGTTTDYILDCIKLELNSKPVATGKYFCRYLNCFSEKNKELPITEVDIKENYNLIKRFHNMHVGINDTTFSGTNLASIDKDILVKIKELFKMDSLDVDDLKKQYYLKYSVTVGEKVDSPAELLITEFVSIEDKNGKPEFYIDRVFNATRKGITYEWIIKRFPYIGGFWIMDFLTCGVVEKEQVENLNDLPINQL